MLYIPFPPERPLQSGLAEIMLSLLFEEGATNEMSGGDVTRKIVLRSSNHQHSKRQPDLKLWKLWASPGAIGLKYTHAISN